MNGTLAAPWGLPARTRRTIAAGGGVRSGICGLGVEEVRGRRLQNRLRLCRRGEEAAGPSGCAGRSVRSDCVFAEGRDERRGPGRWDQSPTLEAGAQSNSHNGPPPLLLQHRLQPPRPYAGPAQTRRSGWWWSSVAPVRWEVLTSRIAFIPEEPRSGTLESTVSFRLVSAGHRDHLQRSAALTHSLACRRLEHHAWAPAIY